MLKLIVGDELDRESRVGTRQSKMAVDGMRCSGFGSKNAENAERRRRELGGDKEFVGMCGFLGSRQTGAR